MGLPAGHVSQGRAANRGVLILPKSTGVLLPVIRTHRAFGAAAVCHAAVVTAVCIVLLFHGEVPFGRLWVVFVTSWLVWPVLLLLHHGRSLSRVAIPVLISLLLLWPAWRDYQFSAPAAMGLPLGVRLTPRDLMDYFVAHHLGRADAEADLRAGRLALENYGFPPPTAYREALQTRGIGLRHTAGCTEVTAEVIGHLEGYNEVAELEIERRFGKSFLPTALATSYAALSTPD